MTEARAYSVLSGVLVAVSGVIFICAAYLAVSVPWQLFGPVSLLLAWCLVRGEFARRASLGLRRDEDLGFDGESPRWLWIAGPVLVLAFLPGLFLTNDGHFTDLSASSAQEQRWSERGGKYFTRRGVEPESEVSKAEYERDTRGVLKFVALGFAFFSFVSLVLWQQEELARKRRDNES